MIRAKTREMRTWGWYFLIALVAEVFASWWAWGRAPTDSLRVLYEGDFLAYEVERLIPWLIVFALLGIIRLLIKRKSAA